jgi:hypothetical protein
VNKLLAIAFLGVLTTALPGKKYTITHYNITFAPDMSNRTNPDLYRRPLNDVDILKIITADLYQPILRWKRSENQKDKLRIDFIDKGLISTYQVHTDKLLIDFGRFQNQLSRIDYIMNKSDVRPTFKQEINGMVSEYYRINSAAAKQNFGADIWTFLNEGIDDKIVLKDEEPFKQDDITYQNKYRNILILPTDGYIEAGIFGKGFDLGKKTIDQFRNAFLNSGETDMDLFFRQNPKFRIKPVKNARLKNLEILVVELYDRSLTKAGVATVHPTDMEIIKLFWCDWLQHSGVKRFELHPIAGSKDEAEKVILNFLDINKMQQSF